MPAMFFGVWDLSFVMYKKTSENNNGRRAVTIFRCHMLTA